MSFLSSFPLSISMRRYARILSTPYIHRALAVTTTFDPISSLPQDYEQKYKEKLLQKAKERGFNSIDELKTYYKTQASSSSSSSSSDSHSDEISNSVFRKVQIDLVNQSQLPSHVKPLNQIVHLDRLLKEPTETIKTLWLEYLSTKDVVSAVIPGDTYTLLHARAKQYPKFVLPVLEDSNPTQAQTFLLEHSGHQSFFTPLSYYQQYGETAPVVLSVTYYTDCLTHQEHPHDIVLMYGEPDVNRISLQTAKRLVQLMQLFYLKNSNGLQLLHQFHHEPNQFQFNSALQLVQHHVQTSKQTKENEKVEKKHQTSE